MAQNAAARLIAAREVAARIFTRADIATLNLDDLVAAVGSIDDTMDLLPANQTSNQTMKQNLLARLPDPFKATATTQQKAVALVCWALKEAGII